MRDEEDLEFVQWREEFVSQHRGNRVVHYYLDDSFGNSYRAVVGKERSLRHMLYVIDEDFAKSIWSDSPDAAGVVIKWRARREVVDWLSGFICRQPQQNGRQEYHSSSPRTNSTKKVPKMDQFKLKSHNTDISWTGDYSICSKQLKHFQAYHRNGTTIPRHSFVLVMSEDEENLYIAYLEDMYEDKKGMKKTKVRWFHQHKEVLGPIPPPTPHPREIFVTPYSQVISIECVDGLVTILTPEHYEKCLSDLPDIVFICYRQYSNNKFKHFDLSTLPGYFQQTILSWFDIHKGVSGEDRLVGNCNNFLKSEPKKSRVLKPGDEIAKSNMLRMRISCRRNTQVSPLCLAVRQNLKSVLNGRKTQCLSKVAGAQQCCPPLAFSVNSRIEVLCQDSGIRGCWFRCTILELSHKRFKVRYDDVQNADNDGNLEEWIFASRPATIGTLGMRHSGRQTVRPHRLSDNPYEEVSFKVGTQVDVWWNDGWWEGAILSVGKDQNFEVFFPGEELVRTFSQTSLRISKDWFQNRWIDLAANSDIQSSICNLNHNSKLPPPTTNLDESSENPTKENEEAAAVPPGNDKPLLNSRKRIRDAEI